jgi:hypothetical protein
MLTLTSLVLLASTALAHEVRPALLKLTQSTEGKWQAVFKQPQVQGRFLNLKVKTNCDAGIATSILSGAALQESFQLNCLNKALNFVEIEGLDRTMIDTMVTVESATGRISNHLISATQPTLYLNGSVPSVPVYLLLGVEHLVFGVDHVLFILILLYIVSGWKNLVKVVTSFTLAHSITLGLAAFDIVKVSQAPVEALIALSVVLLALESLRTEKGLISRYPWVVAFIFGLLHGLGFASALADIGLPEASAITALFLFNVGIELGQLAIVAAALGFVYLVGRSQIRFVAATTSLPIYFVGSVASYWFIDRAVQIVF